MTIKLTEENIRERHQARYAALMEGRTHFWSEVSPREMAELGDAHRYDWIDFTHNDGIPVDRSSSRISPPPTSAPSPTPPTLPSPVRKPAPTSMTPQSTTNANDAAAADAMLGALTGESAPRVPSKE